MNNRFIRTMALIASSVIFVSGCGDTSSFETPNTSDDTPTNAGIVSQRNLIVESSDGFPKVIDLLKGSFTAESVDIVVTIGDLKNQLLTDEHIIFFKTEWGLIEPSCTTTAGSCSVIWRTGDSSNIPGTLTSVITAWTIGEESFTDTNGNGKFDDADTTFEDLEEPFLDINLDGVFDAAGGDELIDVVNGNDLTGINGVHDFGDTFLNSPNCTHSTLCSTVRNTIFVWNSTFLVLTGPPP